MATFDPAINPITAIRPLTMARPGDPAVLAPELAGEEQRALIATLQDRGTWRQHLGTGAVVADGYAYHQDQPGVLPGYNWIIIDWLPDEHRYRYYAVAVQGEPHATINYACGHIGMRAVRGSEHKAELQAGLCGHCTNRTAQPERWAADEAAAERMIEQARIALTGTPEEQEAMFPPRWTQDDETGDVYQVAGRVQGPAPFEGHGDSFDGEPF